MLIYVLSDKCIFISILFKYYANKYPNEFNKIKLIIIINITII